MRSLIRMDRIGYEYYVVLPLAVEHYANKPFYASRYSLKACTTINFTGVLTNIFPLHVTCVLPSKLLQDIYIPLPFPCWSNEDYVPWYLHTSIRLLIYLQGRGTTRLLTYIANFNWIRNMLPYNHNNNKQ